MAIREPKRLECNLMIINRLAGSLRCKTTALGVRFHWTVSANEQGRGENSWRGCPPSTSHVQPLIPIHAYFVIPSELRISYYTLLS